MTYGQRSRAEGRKVANAIKRADENVVATLKLNAYEAMVVRKALEAMAYNQDTLQAKDHSGGLLKLLHQNNSQTCSRLAAAITQQEKNR